MATNQRNNPQTGDPEWFDENQQLWYSFRSGAPVPGQQYGGRPMQGQPGLQTFNQQGPPITLPPAQAPPSIPLAGGVPTGAARAAFGRNTQLPDTQPAPNAPFTQRTLGADAPLPWPDDTGTDARTRSAAFDRIDEQPTIGPNRPAYQPRSASLPGDAPTDGDGRPWQSSLSGVPQVAEDRTKPFVQGYRSPILPRSVAQAPLPSEFPDQQLPPMLPGSAAESPNLRTPQFSETIPSRIEAAVSGARERFAIPDAVPSDAKNAYDSRNAAYKADTRAIWEPWAAAAGHPSGQMGSAVVRQGGYAPGASDGSFGGTPIGPDIGGGDAFRASGNAAIERAKKAEVDAKRQEVAGGIMQGMGGPATARGDELWEQNWTRDRGTLNQYTQRSKAARDAAMNNDAMGARGSYAGVYDARPKYGGGDGSGVAPGDGLGFQGGRVRSTYEMAQGGVRANRDPISGQVDSYTQPDPTSQAAQAFNTHMYNQRPSTKWANNAGRQQLVMDAARSRRIDPVTGSRGLASAQLPSAPPDATQAQGGLFGAGDWRVKPKATNLLDS